MRGGGQTHHQWRHGRRAQADRRNGIVGSSTAGGVAPAMISAYLTWMCFVLAQLHVVRLCVQRKHV